MDQLSNDAIKPFLQLFLILISLLGAISLTTFTNLLRKSLHARFVQEKRS